MNVLFLTLLSFDSIQERTIYTDLLREFVKNGHQIYAISPTEKRKGEATHLLHEGSVTILRLQIGNTQKTNIIEKGISTVMIEPIFKKAIRTFFSDVKFDIVLFSTPPITLVGAVDYVRKRDKAKTYLLLKDIFPQNAVDLGMMGTIGVKGLLYKHFRKKEKKLYSISDRIGCMSQANVDFVIRNNPGINPQIVEVCPNSIEIIDKSVNEEAKKEIRLKYNVPLDKTVFVYGGNLGKPQGVPFLIDCLKKCSDMEDVFFLIVGDGTEYRLLEEYVSSYRPKNMLLMNRLSKDDYDTLVGACDVGLIFLDYRFSIPNFPSRLLCYMQAKIPVLACTDPNTDIGEVIESGHFGWWCKSNDTEAFIQTVNHIKDSDCRMLGLNGYKYLNEHYSSEDGYKIIINSLGEKAK